MSFIQVNKNLFNSSGTCRELLADSTTPFLYLARKPADPVPVSKHHLMSLVVTGVVK